MFLVRALWAAFWISSLALAETNKTMKIILGAKIVEPDIEKQTWNWGPDSRCRLLAHQSIIVYHRGKDLLIFDGGMGKFNYRRNGEHFEVLELNPRTVVIDLSKSFTSRGFIPESQSKKPLGVPVVNRFSLWAGSNQGSILMGGGHFYDADDWRNSSYWLEKKDIPPFSIWKYDLDTSTWTEVVLPTNKSNFKRGWGGAAVSVPSTNQSYYIGGLWTPRSSSESLDGFSIPLSGMLVYNHTAGTLTNESFGETGMAYWHGSANHLKIGKKDGFLIALMAETFPGGVPIKDDPAINEERGISLSFRYVMFYNLGSKKWTNQSTTFYNGEVPVSRTRFCGQTVYSRETKTWELWVHGGMLMDPLGEAAPDTWVLSMPSFIWTRVEMPDSIVRMRSHTCHAVGSQLLIIGGYPPSAQVEKNATCDPELIKVLDMNTLTSGSHYTPGTVYKTPELVRKNAEFDLKRKDPQSGWADDELRDAFRYSTTPSSPFSRGKIAGIAVSGVIVIVLAFILYKWRSGFQCPPWGPANNLRVQRPDPHTPDPPRQPSPDRPFPSPDPKAVEGGPPGPVSILDLGSPQYLVR